LFKVLWGCSKRLCCCAAVVIHPAVIGLFTTWYDEYTVTWTYSRPLKVWLTYLPHLSVFCSIAWPVRSPAVIINVPPGLYGLGKFIGVVANVTLDRDQCLHEVWYNIWRTWVQLDSKWCSCPHNILAWTSLSTFNNSLSWPPRWSKLRPLTFIP
jgi:hypothetical protein